MMTRPLMTLIFAGLLSTLVTRNAMAQQLALPYGAPVGIEAARKIAVNAFAEARKNGWTIAVAVVDTAGDLVLFERMDNTQVASVGISQDKARTAARFKRHTKALEDALVAGGRTAILGLPGATPVEGGVPLIVDGKIIGAVGVSGATSPQDAQCAIAGSEALGKQPPPPATPAKPGTPPPPPPPKK
jgi:uncharacterized protein GlcG (DUF336 family)